MEYVDRLSTPSARAPAWLRHTLQLPATVAVCILPRMQQVMIEADRQPRSAPVVGPQLPPTWHYFGPTAALASPCRCNTVYYTLLNACGVCGGGLEYLTSVAFLHRDTTLVD